MAANPITVIALLLLTVVLIVSGVLAWALPIVMVVKAVTPVDISWPGLVCLWLGSIAARWFSSEVIKVL